MTLDLSSDPPFQPTPPSSRSERDTPDRPARKFIGIRFNCCGVYVRIYVNRDGTAYEGRCPKCFKPVKLKIGPGGTDHRFFEVK